MPSLYSILFVSLVGSSSIAFLLIMLILHKGELCPGQKGRIQRQISTLVSFITLAGLSGFESQQDSWLVVLVFASALIGWGLSYRLNKLKHKRSLPLMTWWGMGAPLLVVAATLTSLNGVILFSLLTSGAAISHWLIVKAKHRLSSFDKLLPLLGLISAMLSMMTVCIYLLLNQQLVDNVESIKQFVIMTTLLVSACLLWLVPQFRKTPPPAQLLLAVALLSFISNLSLQKLIA
ncbi:hypothetical protein ACVFI8_03925 [Agarivorans sp. MS3-6]